MQNIIFIALVVYACIAIVTQCNTMQINNQKFIVIHNIKITSYLTTLEVREVKSRIVCAGLCVDHSSCCSVSFDIQTTECMLDYDCFPERTTWQNVTFLQKSTNVTNQPSQNEYTSYSTTSEKTRAETPKSDITPGETTSVETATRETANGKTTTRDTANGKTTTREITRYATTKGNSHSYDTTIYRTNFETTDDETDMEKTVSVETTNENTSNETGDDISNETDEEIHITSTDKPGCQNYDTTPANKFYITGIFSDCSEIPSGSPSGVYIIYVKEKPVDVYCEMTDYGQWTVIQRRLNGTTDFYRNWQDYKQGFGNVAFEYWLGNDNLYQILSTKNYKLRIDFEDWNCDKRYTEYDTFVVGSEETKYKLSITGYSGDSGDSIVNPPSGSTYRMNGMEFTTSDRDNDKHWFINCASDAKHSGWWFNWSTDANLNGIYYINGQTVSDGVFWNSWHSSEYSLKRVSMKIKPY